MKDKYVHIEAMLFYLGFDDPLKEIQKLIALIKNDITALNAAVSDLQTLQNMEKIQFSILILFVMI